MRESLLASDAAFRARQQLRRAKATFENVRKAETGYGRSLRKIARHVGDLIEGRWQPDDPEALAEIVTALRNYAAILKPWAAVAAKRMLAEVAARDRTAWRRVSRENFQSLRGTAPPRRSPTKINKNLFASFSSEKEDKIAERRSNPDSHR